MKPDGMVNLQSVCEDVFGFSVGRYHSLSKEGIVPPPEKGRIHLVKSAAAYIGHLRAKIEKGEERPGLTAERERLTKLQADLAQRDLDERDANLLPFDEVKTAWARLVTAFKARVLAIPVTVTPLVYGQTMPVIKERLEKGVYDALTELAGLKYDDADRPVVRGKRKPRKAATKRKSQ
jgi:phage terminase Nu1 subunit (DNA packaging protein)